MATSEKATSRNDRVNDAPLVSAPAISLPKGGGAIKGIGEKFAANPVTGTGSMSVPIATSPGRGGFGPQLTLGYDSGAGNGPFGLGWSLSLPSITRRTDKGLPRYLDSQESDVFILAGAEDLVPTLDGADRLRDAEAVDVYGTRYLVRTYRPRVEGLFALIERWVEDGAADNMFWRVVTRENVTSWYGRTSDSRIVVADDGTRIFQWLLCETYDDRGNAITYSHRREDAAGVDLLSVEEANRSPEQRLANRYPLRIRYGNTRPFMPDLAPAGATWLAPDDVPGQNWLFEIVFTYGAANAALPATSDDAAVAPWVARADPFSSCRSGSEVRTYRLCRRVLMFHHFGVELGADAYLVRSTELDYAEPSLSADPNEAGYTTLRSVTHRAYQKRSPADTTYESRDFPPLTFGYSRPKVQPVARTIARRDLENLPAGTQGAGYRWIDLEGEGLSGALVEQDGAWHYAPNDGDGTFSASHVVSRRPAMAALGAGRQQLIDLAGDGEIDLVDFHPPHAGFHERTRDGEWTRFVPFDALPNLDWSDDSLRFVDLTGDGLADAVITEHEVITWYPSLGEGGFDSARHARAFRDEDAGPRLVFDDRDETIFLADMSGDGLTDLVRIRNGNVSYWPNLGYGRFGRRVILRNSPRFDRDERFDPRRIRLADVDGSGPVDIIYLGGESAGSSVGAQLYFNRSGNALSDALTIDLPLSTENLDAVQVADVLGNGTACLVWNSHLPADAERPVRYVDLMGGTPEPPSEHRKHEKPHLLISVDNNLGGVTEIEYTPSTRFYLQDKHAKTPWITRLPFPVHCVSRVTVRDQWRRTAFSSTYSYHHGYFDGAEREFRGFARVEQVDIEDFGTFAAGNADSPFITPDLRLYQPPVKTITWFHTGAAPNGRGLLDQLRREFFPSRFTLTGAFTGEKELPDPDVPARLTPAEWREAMRACKGRMLRQEIYELDVDDLVAPAPAHTPVRLFAATSHALGVRLLQARGENPHAVFLVSDREAVSYQYELALPRVARTVDADPRVTHSITLREDDRGAVQQAVRIGYGRWAPGDYGTVPRPELIREVQAEMHVSYTETRHTSDVRLPPVAPGTTRAVRHYRLAVPCEVRTYEITGVEPRAGANTYFDVDHLRRHELCEDATYPPVVTPPDAVVPLAPLEYHERPSSAAPHRRIIEHTRALFFDDASDASPPSQPLAFAQLGPRGLKYEDYRLALTDGLLDDVFAHANAAGVVDDKLAWELVGAAGGAPAVTVRDVLERPSVPGSPYLTSGYMLGTGLDAAFSGQLWMRSGTAGFGTLAHEHFFLPQRYTDPFGNPTSVDFDAHDLLVRESVDALGNSSRVQRVDYRVLAPAELIDANGNVSETTYDIRGLVVAVAARGKQRAGAWEGDTLTGFDFDLANPPSADVVAFCTSSQPDRALAATWLGDASSRFVHHYGDEGGVWASRPAGACAIAREEHAGQLVAPAKSLLQLSLECTDGSGAILMTKVQAEPDRGSSSPRWIVNGRALLNNKGKTVKQYEPAFVASFGCQTPPANGVSPTMFYDAAGRVVRTEFPDDTLSRIEFSPWDVTQHDQNDTVMQSGWYAARTAPAASAEEQRAAALAAMHADTPSRTLLDSMGREVISVAHNRVPSSDPAYRGTPFADRPWLDERSVTFTKLDAEGKMLWVRDAMGNLVTQHILPLKPTRASDDPDQARIDAMPVGSAPAYDLAGNLLYQHGMDAGDRWVLTDAAQKALLAWDETVRTLDDGTTLAERRLFHVEYDRVHRPTAQWLRVNADARALVEAFEYVDASSFTDAAGVVDATALAAAQDRNLIGQTVRHFDPSGLTTVERVSFKGIVEEVTRSLVSDPAAPVVSWSVPDRTTLLAAPGGAPETFRRLQRHDALGRLTTLYNWHRDTAPGTSDRVSVYVPEYNERGLLRAETVYVRATKTTVGGNARFTAHADPARRAQAITRIDWNARGQRTRLVLGNGTVTRYTYDDRTFRLASLYTLRDARFPGDCGGAAPDDDAPPRSCGVQQLRFTYDPIGNLTHVQDDAQQTIYFANQQVEPSSDFVHDALYRLIEATGRENAAAVGAPPHSEGRWQPSAVPSPDATRRFTQRYRYDLAGNITTMRHLADRLPGQPDGRWTRRYAYAFEDLQQPASNQLWQTWEGNDRTGAVTYRHDPHGNLLNLASTAPGVDMRWEWRDMIRALDLQGGGDAFYSYGIDKTRTRKRIVRNGGITEDRIYLDGYELYRRSMGDPEDPVEEIETFHLTDGSERVLMIEDVLRAKPQGEPGPNGLRVREQTLWRYQYGNHAGSASVELDDEARMISYEEYHPYGTSAYRLMSSAREVPAKRYRYTGMERDEESGLGYHRRRYLIPSLGRWASPDPALLAGGPNLWCYASNRPTSRVDPEGDQDVETQQRIARFQATYGKRPDNPWDRIIPSQRPIDHVFKEGSQQYETIRSAEATGKAATAVTYVSLGAFAVIEAAPLLIAAGRTAIASAWEGTVGPAFQAAKTIAQNWGAGIGPALAMASQHLNRFAQNITSFVNPDPTNVLGSEGLAFAHGAAEAPEFVIKQYGTRTAAKVEAPVAKAIVTRTAKFQAAFEGTFSQTEQLGKLWMQATENANTFDAAREAFWTLVRTGTSKEAKFVRAMIADAGFIFRPKSALGTAPVLSEHIAKFSEQAAVKWAGNDPFRKDVAARLMELREGGSVPVSDMADRLLSIDHTIARANGGPEYNPFYLRFMLMRDNSIKGDRF